MEFQQCISILAKTKAQEQLGHSPFLGGACCHQGDTETGTIHRDYHVLPESMHQPPMSCRLLSYTNNRHVRHLTCSPWFTKTPGPCCRNKDHVSSQAQQHNLQSIRASTRFSDFYNPWTKAALREKKILDSTFRIQDPCAKEFLEFYTFII